MEKASRSEYRGYHLTPHTPDNRQTWVVLIEHIKGEGPDVIGSGRGVTMGRAIVDARELIDMTLDAEGRRKMCETKFRETSRSL